MAKIIEIQASATNKTKKHKIEITVEFDEPVSEFTAQTVVLEAISEILYSKEF